MQLAKLHNKLVECVDDVIVCFAITTMLATGAAFVYIVTTMFVCFQAAVFGDVDMAGEAGSFILWSIFYAILLLAISAIGHLLKSSGKAISLKIHQALFTCDDLHMRDDLIMFSQQLFHRVPAFSCGLFHFDWTLIYSIVSAITTYTMILVQFDTSFIHKFNEM